MKTKQEKLAEFTKANKIRKEKIASREGYTNAEAYKNYLTGKRNKVNPLKNQKVIPTIHNVYILDASGSMAGTKLNNAISGINSEIRELKKVKDINYTQTIVSFSYSYDIKFPYYLCLINDVNDYDDSPRGDTALNDSVYISLAKLLDDTNISSKVLVKVFTDGGENGSRKYSKVDVNKLIKKCEDTGRFTITFVGTKDDTDRAIKDYGIRISNALIHDNTSVGVANAFTMSTRSTVSYSSKVAKGEDVLEGFYKEVGKL